MQTMIEALERENAIISAALSSEAIASADLKTEADLLAGLILEARKSPSVFACVDVGWISEALAIAERRVKT